ncbi:SMC-Scp complex subunit ScpB [Candidatus Desantisbacteria bacterium CG1_02_38_46]|uniref:SMC-Scp complex subunit ScpB n=2 Tax=unclassified Candidatus Desantisiibacteriota TaxID=3106372 RepID=A0A2H9PBB8_9BACT|nr:MAG: SMC-Scp complex subunit ScpB [Candidatus Desantisbacteria bacterium CG1_02_38_46]PIZ15170.1 MAG: SMC-Scp complex subunit ScpB [Candidatus Desantisbacteria bacterium CG_4_10_14_0_8_um_filter_39_17]
MESAQNLPPKSIIECLLFVSDVPLNPQRLAHLTGLLEEEVKRILMELTQEYERDGRSFKIAEIADGFLMCTRHEFAPWIKLLYASRNRAKLSKASLEVLAILAYRQPITRAEIEAIRGVDCSGVLHTILERRLIKISGRKKVLGRPLLYRTTDEFLIYFGLKDLSELPRVEELRL